MQARATLRAQVSMCDVTSLCTLFRIDFHRFLKSCNRGYTVLETGEQQLKHN